MFKASHDFIVLSLDSSRAVEEHVQEGGRATALSILDHYIARPSTPTFNTMTILEYAQRYTMPKELGTQPNRRNKKVVVITQPYISPDPAGPKYKQYCQQSLMKYKSFSEISELLAGCETYADAYAEFLQTEDIPPSLQEDIFRLQQHQQQQNTANNEVNCISCVFYVLYLQTFH